MAEGLIGFLVRDLGDGLEARRLPSASAPAADRLLLRWMFGCLLVGATLFVFCGYHAGFVRLNAAAAQAPGWLWQSLTVLGDERVAFALGLLFARRYPQVLWALIVSALIATLYTQSLKHGLGALRPPAVLPPDSFNLLGPALRKASFPSGHSTTVAVFCGVWVCFLSRTWARTSLLLLALTVGLSRTAVGVHWPIDVAAGLAGGLAAAWIGVRLAGRIAGARNARVHLIFVVIAAGYAVSLLLSDRGYHAAAELQWLIGGTALGYATLTYVMLPGLRWWRQGRQPELLPRDDR
jgi:membrane-associated phospholipid phosphatase